tara:strand:- start:752 stop:937 length:186 start_codon:yes stop_codon:yes gene_type:complete
MEGDNSSSLRAKIENFFMKESLSTQNVFDESVASKARTAQVKALGVGEGTRATERQTTILF